MYLRQHRSRILEQCPSTCFFHKGLAGPQAKQFAFGLTVQWVSIEPSAFFRERELSVAVDLMDLLRAGASDRLAMVRRRAAEGLIALRHDSDLKQELDYVAAILHNDPNIGVRTRIEFFRRKQAEV